MSKVVFSHIWKTILYITWSLSSLIPSLWDFNAKNALWSSSRTHTTANVVAKWPVGLASTFVTSTVTNTCISWQRESIVHYSWATPVEISHITILRVMENVESWVTTRSSRYVTTFQIIQPQIRTPDLTLCWAGRWKKWWICGAPIHPSLGKAATLFFLDHRNLKHSFLGTRQWSLLPSKNQDPSRNSVTINRFQLLQKKNLLK